MATGNMGFSVGKQLMRYFMPLVLLGLPFSPAGLAQDVGLAGLMSTKALLMIDGGEPQAVRVGETLDGVKLLAIQNDQAIVEIGGKKRPLRIGQHAVGSVAADGMGKIVLTANEQGHFYANGSVNGTAIRFMVDTGATLISLGLSDAKRLGLDFNKGQKALSNTANGQAVVSRVQLDLVRIGDVTLRNVDAVIHQTDMPIALLGMSFLSRMEMNNDGNTMTLKKRF